jgi:hypothetical protein
MLGRARRLRWALSVKPTHDLLVSEQVVETLRIMRGWRSEAEPVRVEAQLLPGGVTSHAETLLRSPARVCGKCPLSWWRSSAAGRRPCSGSLENNDDVRATVEGSRFATRLDLDLEEALVPCIVARGEEVRS